MGSSPMPGISEICGETVMQVPPKVNSVWRHFKGTYYVVKSVAFHTEQFDQSKPSESALVIYQAFTSDPTVWARPLSMWFERVEVDGKSIPRFTRVQAENEIELQAFLRSLDSVVAEELLTQFVRTISS